MAFPAAAGIAAGASGLNTLSGNVFNYTEAERAQGRTIANMDHAQNLNRAMFDHQMTQQKEYDATKYLRAVGGMRSAGLNPVLAAGGTTTASAAASGGSAGGGGGSQASGAPGQLDPIGAMSAVQQMRLMKAQARFASAQAGREEIREDLERKAKDASTSGYTQMGRKASNFFDHLAEKFGATSAAVEDIKNKRRRSMRPQPADTKSGHW